VNTPSQKRKGGIDYGSETENEMSEDRVKEGWDPKIAAIVCNWCTYAGADLAGISRIQYPPNVRIIRVPCTGRINPFYIVRALQEGADGVLVSGCHPGECHYITGNLSARRKFAMLKRFIDYLGLEADRTTFTWCSASEGERFAKVVSGVTERVRQLGPAKKLVKSL
jgi:coenzyme F420-reducing hydrogenase delta subunit